MRVVSIIYVYLFYAVIILYTVFYIFLYMQYLPELFLIPYIFNKKLCTVENDNRIVVFQKFVLIYSTNGIWFNSTPNFKLYSYSVMLSAPSCAYNY